jgi:hypothetical protein
MPDIEFRGWPKIARLNRDIIITEKIDGTNAAIGVLANCSTEDPCDGCLNSLTCERAIVYAQSRTRIITPEKDNFGFATWVRDHADVLRDVLGEGLHFGEWWGKGINRGYDLRDKRFSLFNTEKYEGIERVTLLLRTVPILYQGPFSQTGNEEWLTHPPVEEALHLLRTEGSQAEPGYMKPEGIVIYHTAAKTMFKVTLEHDEKPKGSTE